MNATISFSLNKPTIASCNQSSLLWGTLINHDVNICADFQNQDPTFNYVSKDFVFFVKGINDFLGQRSAAPGIVITYPKLALDDGNIELTLRCNQTAPATSDVNFFVDRWEGTTIYVTGYSYYGNILLRRN